ncbi:MAG: hypothetical protein ABH839_00755 [Chloroflexota bacterium]
MKSELKEQEKGITDRLKDAINRGDTELAQELAEQLPRDFHNMYMLLHQAIGSFYLPYIQQQLEAGQGKLAGNIRQAIESKDFERAKRLLDEKGKQYLAIHDAYVEILARLFGAIDDAFGDRALEGAHRYWAERIKKWYDKREAMSAEEQVIYCAFMFNEHLSEQVTIEEDAEKYTVTLDGCGSGGRLLRKGFYDRSPGSLNKISRPQAMTAGSKDFPIYCTHCQVLFGAFPLDNYGNPLWIIRTPQRPEEPCRILIYKDREKIPQEYRRALQH